MTFSKYLKTFTCISALMLFFCLTDLHAQQSYNSLFWEISGNGLSKPSYLYGTIHVKDKRVFNLSDSVMIRLNECPAAALELDMDSLRQMGIKMGLEQSNQVAKDKDSNNGSEKYFTDEEEKIIRKGIARITGTPEDQISLSNPSMIFFLLTQLKYMKGDMPEVLDQRIFNIAKSKGKKLTGIETFDEQMNSFSSVGDFDLKKAILKEIENLDSSDSSLQKMIDAYCSQDLIRLNKLLKADEDEYPDMYYKILDLRNVRMSDRIANIIRKDQTFIAIGSGHLYGDNGVISLLRKKGYSLRPVLPSYTKGLASEFIDFKAEDIFKKFTSAEGAFEAGFPNEPVFQEKRIPVSGSQDTLSLFYWASLDNAGTASYMVKYNDLGQGRFMMSDSAYLTRSLQGAVANSSGNLYYASFKKFLGLPALEYKINVMNNITLKVLMFIRGNRDYALISSQAKFDSLMAEKFFSTFRLTDYAPVKWTGFSDPSGAFNVDLPVTNPQATHDTVYNRSALHVNVYMASDPYSGQNYTLQEEVLSKYFYTQNDSVLFANAVKALRHQTDSVVSITPLNFNGMTARDIIMKSSVTRNCKRFRFIVNGNRFYTLFTCAPEEMLNSDLVGNFYKSFKVTEGVKDIKLLFTNKSEMILNDLESPDTTVRRAAFEYMPLYEFKFENLPHVYSLLKKSFPDDTAEVSIRSRLLDIVANVGDSTSADFVYKLYPELPDNQYLLIKSLRVLSVIKTDEAMNKFKELLFSRTPEGEDVFRIFLSFYNDTERIDKLFPDVLKLLDKDNYREPVYSLISERIDSLPQLKTDILALSDKIQNDFREFSAKRDSLLSIAENDTESESDNSGLYDDVVTYLLKIVPELKKDPASEKIIAKLANDSSAVVSVPAVIALVKMNGKCDNKIISRLAEDRTSKNYLYEQLLLINKDNLFPAKYRTKEIMAENDMYTNVTSEYQAPSEIVFLEKKEAEYSGEKGIFYLYKFNFESEPDKWYTGISGPQPIDSQKPVAYGKATTSNFRLFNNDIEYHWQDLLPKE